MGRFTGRHYFDAIETSLKLAGVLVGVEVVDSILPFGLDRFGIRPRELAGLPGILFAPLLHGGMGHLLANLGPLLALLILLFWDRRHRPWQTLGFVWVMGGLGTWLLGRGGAVHIGASGLVYGLAAYLVAVGVVGRCWRAAVTAVLVTLVYGGLIYGVLPRTGPISWESHLCGAVSGVIAALRNRSRIKARTTRA